MTHSAYTPRRPSRSTFLDVRGLRYHLRSWGEVADPALVLLHGGQDGSATFQFLVDAFQRGWHVMAPDWRGHGLSDRAPQGYWFPDYLADLDALLRQLSPDAPVPLVGHSLGGNVACLYAGLRPERISRLVSLDGFGLPDRSPDEAPRHLRRWLESWREPPLVTTYANVQQAAARLIKANPRLTEPKALFLAEHLIGPRPDGRVAWLFDPMHRMPLATLHRAAEWAACIRAIEAPTLWIGSGRVFPPSLERDALDFEQRLALLGNGAFVRVPETGHNLHHDRPEAVVGLIEEFLTQSALEGGGERLRGKRQAI